MSGVSSRRLGPRGSELGGGCGGFGVRCLTPGKRKIYKSKIWILLSYSHGHLY
jgi:hypothetical protein